MEHSYSRGSDSLTAFQEVPRLLCHPNPHCHIRGRPYVLYQLPQWTSVGNYEQTASMDERLETTCTIALATGVKDVLQYTLVCEVASSHVENYAICVGRHLHVVHV